MELKIYEVVPDTTCVITIRKVGSNSMDSAIGRGWHKIISSADAMLLPNRVIFFKDHNERIDSNFKHFSRVALNNSKLTGILPPGIITGFGLRYSGELGCNEHHWRGRRVEVYNALVASLKAEGLTDEQIVLWLNRRDYKAFIGHLLSNAEEHWAPISTLAMHEGLPIWNIAYKFDNSSDISRDWLKHVTIPLGVENSWPSVPRGPDYRQNDIDSLYVGDTVIRSGIN